jgi:hypothetical protein
VTASDSEARKSCFVAMPVTTPELYVEKLGDSEHFVHVFEHLFRPALEQIGFIVIPPSASGASLIHAEIIKNLEQADLVLCDLSSLNPNVFFELGIRTALNRPVALIKDNFTTQIPFDLNAINTHTYNNSLTPWALRMEIPSVASHIEHVANTNMAGNALWHYFGLTKPGTPAEIEGDPTTAKLDFVISEIEKLQLASRNILVEQGQGLTIQQRSQVTALRELISPILARHELDKEFTVLIDEYKKTVDLYITDAERSNGSNEDQMLENRLQSEIQRYISYRLHVAFTPF